MFTIERDIEQPLETPNPEGVPLLVLVAIGYAIFSVLALAGFAALQSGGWLDSLRITAALALV